MLCYEHGGDIYRNNVRLDFSINTNPLGIPGAVIDAVTANIGTCINYPDPYCEELCRAIAQFENVPESHVLCGNGAADIIYRLVFSKKPKRALVCAPTFSEYERAVLLSGGEVKYHMLSGRDGFMLTERILDYITSDINMVFICNPNNPTGRLASTELLEAIACKCIETGSLLIVDECFLPFTDGSSLKTRPEVVILKAFTKLYSMPGLRLGYMLCGDEKVLAGVRHHAQTWSVSGPAQTAGIAALSCAGWTEKTVEYVKTEREFLTDGLCMPGIDLVDSDVNFILMKTVTPLYPLFLEHGVLVRNCANFRGLNDSYIRICIKTREENEEFIRITKEVLNG